MAQPRAQPVLRAHEGACAIRHVESALPPGSSALQVASLSYLPIAIPTSSSYSQSAAPQEYLGRVYGSAPRDRLNHWNWSEIQATHTATHSALVSHTVHSRSAEHC